MNIGSLPSSIAFFTARRPSLTASLICVRVCLLGPFTSRVTERGFSHFSMKVYFSSPCKQHSTTLLSNLKYADRLWALKTVCYTFCKKKKKDNKLETYTHTSVCSYISPACPRHSGVRSSTEFIAIPPQARTSLQTKTNK